LSPLWRLGRRGLTPVAQIKVLLARALLAIRDRLPDTAEDPRLELSDGAPWLRVAQSSVAGAGDGLLTTRAISRNAGVCRYLGTPKSLLGALRTRDRRYLYMLGIHSFLDAKPHPVARTAPCYAGAPEASETPNEVRVSMSTKPEPVSGAEPGTEIESGAAIESDTPDGSRAPASESDPVRERWEAHWRGTERSRDPSGPRASSGPAASDPPARGTSSRDPGWLDRWITRIATPDGVVVDVGCGRGIDTELLTSCCARVVALDYTRAALSCARDRAPRAVLMRADLRDGLPLAESSLHAVVASLSLHYFDRQTTRMISAEIARCLRPGGVLLARVNSTRDLHYGASGHPELEPHYYRVSGRPKRFFDRSDVMQLFGSELEIESLEEARVGTIPEKHTWLFCARR